jgi:hypothetical protein
MESGMTGSVLSPANKISHSKSPGHSTGPAIRSSREIRLENLIGTARQTWAEPLRPFFMTLSIARGPQRRRVIRPSQFLDHRRVELPLLKNCQILKFINRLPTATCVFIKTKKSPRTLFLGHRNGSNTCQLSLLASFRARFWLRDRDFCYRQPSLTEL